MSARYRRRHLRFGWWSLLLFLSLGLLLESFHAFKVPGYVDAASETRRLLWRLAHAHGALLAIVNVLWAVAGAPLFDARPRLAPWASRCLICAALLLPAGFFLGGVRVYGGDPGIGVLLVPPGALLLGAAILLTALAASGVGAWAEHGGEADAGLAPRSSQRAPTTAPSTTTPPEAP